MESHHVSRLQLKKELAALKGKGSEVLTPEAAAQLKAEPSSSPNTENET
jgi:hypothetical protein